MKRIPGKILTLVGVAALFLMSGCSHMAAGLAPSASPLPSNDYKVLGHAEGQSEYVSIFGVLPMGTPDYDSAIKEAVGTYPGGKTLINVRTYQTTLFLYLVSLQTLHVEGDVVSY